MKFLLVVFLILSSNAYALNCAQDLEDLLLSKEDIYSDMLQAHRSTIEELHARGIIDFKDISKETIIYARNNSSRERSFLIQSKDKVVAFDKSLKDGWSELNNMAMGFRIKKPAEEQYDVIHSNFMIKTLRGQIVLLARNQFSKEAVTREIVGSPNSAHLLKWFNELTDLVTNPRINQYGEAIAIPAQALSKARFLDVTLESDGQRQLTLLIFDNNIFYLSKNSVNDIFASQKNYGLLDYSDFGFLSKGKDVAFIDSTGSRLVLSKNGLVADGRKEFEAALAQISQKSKGLEVDFLTTFKDEMIEMMVETQTTLQQLGKIQIFKVSGTKGDYISIINGTAFYFSKDGIDLLNTKKTWAILDPQKMGFLSRYHEEIILSDQYILKFTNEGSATITPIAEKSPLFLKEIIESNQAPKELKDIIAFYSAEFAQLLAKTNLTRSDFLKAEMSIVLDKKTGSQMLVFSAGDVKALLVPQVIQGDELFDSSRMVILNQQSSFGFRRMEERVLELPGHMNISVTANGITTKPVDMQSFAQDAVESLVQEESLPSFVREMVQINQKAITELIAKGEMELQDVLPPHSSFATSLKSKQNFWVIKTKSQSIIFEINGKKSSSPLTMTALDKQKHGDRIILLSKEAITSKRTIGFNSEVVEGGDIIDLNEYTQVLSYKAEFLLERKITQRELNKLIEAQQVSPEAFYQKVSTQEELVNMIIAAKREILSANGHFSDEEVDKLLSNITM